MKFTDVEKRLKAMAAYRVGLLAEAEELGNTSPRIDHLMAELIALRMAVQAIELARKASPEAFAALERDLRGEGRPWLSKI